jgi:4-hydroxy-tetrahydrodipicolinate synthase
MSERVMELHFDGILIGGTYVEFPARRTELLKVTDIVGDRVPTPAPTLTMCAT